ncbi:hypothetical protein ACOMHN_057216 [Nucella lapillus]
MNIAVATTWTLLSQTAAAGSQTISLVIPVTWKVEDQIVIATTFHRHSQKESEVHVISAISADGLTLTLRDPLTNEHVVASQLLGDGTTETVRGEVGLVTRNMIFIQQQPKGKGLHVFFLAGKAPEKHRVHGIGFAVRNSLLCSIELPSEGTARILSLRLTTTSGPVNIMSVYAHTLCSAAEAKDEFYEGLETAIKKLPTSEYLYLLGDFNARIGLDHTSWPRCIGHFGVGKLNENGQRLLALCSFHDLCITNTLFFTKPNHRVSWRHPRSRHWHQLDLVITRRPLLNCILTTRSYHSADCDIDHSMVASMVRLQPKQFHRSKQKGRPRINTVMTSVPELRERFADTIQETLSNCSTSSVEERWNHICDATYESAIVTFGKRERENPDWFEAGIMDLEPAISSKRTALLNYKEDPSEKTLAALGKAISFTHRTARQCANNYWQSLCQSIQLSADCGNNRAMYEGMKNFKAFGPSAIKIAPLKSTTGEIITDRTKQMERWAEYYQELYSRETIVTDTAVENTCSLPVMEELDDPPDPRSSVRLSTH